MPNKDAATKEKKMGNIAVPPKRFTILAINKLVELE
jgi:hypothetical protein